MSEDTTTIRVKPDTWKRLNDRKQPGDSFDEIITELLDTADETEADTDH